jgi:hypothetical protein
MYTFIHKKKTQPTGTSTHGILIRIRHHEHDPWRIGLERGWAGHVLASIAN